MDAKRSPWVSVLSAALALAPAALLADDTPNANWPQFRGPDASGIGDGAPTPVEWDVESGKNIKWKTEIPGLAYSCPIVWGDRVYLTTAVSTAEKETVRVGLYGDIMPINDETEHEWRVLCLDKNSGSILWSEVAHKGVPKIKRHPKSTHANSTPATDGKHVVAFFGSEGLYCYDTDGKLLWSKDLGTLDAGFYMVPNAQWGFGSSPIIYDGKVIVQCDVQKNSFLAAFDVNDGKELWRTPRTDVPTWGTPTIWTAGGRTEIVVNGYRQMAGYDPATGRELWTLAGGGDIPVPTPVAGDDLVYLASAHGSVAPLFAVKPDASGDISLPEKERSSEAVAWSQRRNGAYMQTPIVYHGLLYSCRDNGALNCYDPETGKLQFQKRITSGFTGFTASPVAADGKLYFAGETGDVVVVKAGPDPEILATNKMGEITMATPAISNGVLFIRTQHHLFAIGE